MEENEEVTGIEKAAKILGIISIPVGSIFGFPGIVLGTICLFLDSKRKMFQKIGVAGIALGTIQLFLIWVLLMTFYTLIAYKVIAIPQWLIDTIVEINKRVGGKI